MMDGNAALNRLLRLSPEAEPEGYCIAGCGVFLRDLPRRTKPRTICCGHPDCMRTYWSLRRSVVRELIADALVDGLKKARDKAKSANRSLAAATEGGSQR